MDGIEAPVVLEFYEGKVKLRVYDGTEVVFTTTLSQTVTAPAAVAADAPTDDDLAEFDAA